MMKGLLDLEAVSFFLYLKTSTYNVFEQTEKQDNCVYLGKEQHCKFLTPMPTSRELDDQSYHKFLNFFVSARIMVDECKC
ncbi:hypothetical protein GDO81_009924 [Engystomops pustulosus]|uniref:Growth hormone n=1 Tax=Engystomops pustulosus TaxID=76066 RepID=A0AAV7BVC2_ENGPU|nr:hypothetical protein GDO81_009924 [Engystomops pustulosus]